jgi:predicted enzyme involved in methoxymalonyl-ACP biosynthesis
MHNIFKETKLKIRYEKLKQIIHNKNLAYTKYHNTKQLEDEIDYKRQKAVAKREIRRPHRQSWETFISHLESDLYKVKPKALRY